MAFEVLPNFIPKKKLGRKMIKLSDKPFYTCVIPSSIISESVDNGGSKHEQMWFPLCSTLWEYVCFLTQIWVWLISGYTSTDITGLFHISQSIHQVAFPKHEHFMNFKTNPR